MARKEHLETNKGASLSRRDLLLRATLLAGSTLLVDTKGLAQLARNSTDDGSPYPEGRLLTILPFAGERTIAFGQPTKLNAGLDTRQHTDLSLLAPDALITATDKFFVRTSCPDQIDYSKPWTIKIRVAADDTRVNWITQTNFLPDWLAVLGIFTKLLLWFLLVPLFCLRILWKSESARNAVIAVLIVFAGLLCLRWPLTMVLQSAYLDQAVAPNMHMRPNINRTRPFLNAALFINPLDTDCLAARAKSYVESNDFQLALDDYTKLISLKPKWNFPLCPGSNIFCLCMVELEDVYCDRARIFKVTNQIDLAIADLTEAIKLDPKNTEHYFERALLYGKQGDFASAKRDLDAARQLAPAASALLLCQAKLYKAEGRRTEALSVITKYVERTEDYRGYQLRAELYRELAQNVLATADYEKMQKECYKRGLMAPSAATYPYLEALAYKELGKMDEARRCAEKARQLGYRYSEANWAQFGMTEKK